MIVKNVLFESERVSKAFFKLALPVVLGMVITIIYNMVDTYFIAMTGKTELVAGVSLVGPVLYIMVALGDVFGLGGSSFISRLFGQKRYEEGKNISVLCFYLALAAGAVLTVLLMVFRSPMLRFLGADTQTALYADQYYFWLSVGAPFIVLTYIPSNLLRTEGYSVASMSGTVLGAVINVILDPVMIFGLNMGAAGAAIATVLGNAGTCMFFVIFMKKKSNMLSMDPRRFHISREAVRQILAIGIPASLTNIMVAFSTALTNRYLLPFGNDKVAAFGIALKAVNIGVMILVGFAFGAQPLIGYNYGADNKNRLKEILKFSFTFTCTTAAVIGGILAWFAPQIIRLFMDDRIIIETGTSMLRAQMAGIVFEAVIFVSVCTFQSEGKAVRALLLSISRQGVVFAAVLAAFAAAFGYIGILTAQAAADLFTMILALVLMKRKAETLQNVSVCLKV